MQQLVWTMADMGCSVDVIVPIPININYKYWRFPEKTVEKTLLGNKVRVFYPKYFSFGQTDVLNVNPAKITTRNFELACEKVIDKEEMRPDLFYSHFITPAGISAARLSLKYRIPAFMAYGESTKWTIDHFGVDNVRKELKSLCGVIAVSTHNKEMLIEENIIEEDKICVIPNGYRSDRFKKLNQEESRHYFGFPQDKFIIAFVGSFDERKGINRLEKVLDEINDDSIIAVCAGKGRLMPTSKKIVFKEPVNHQDLAKFYSAADVFVLPTQNEGCCNAIIEAMACGLPIISSNGSFNDEILDESCSIRIDPNDINALKAAVLKMMGNMRFKKELAVGSLDKVKNLTLEKRASRIISYMEEQCKAEKADV